MGSVRFPRHLANDREETTMTDTEILGLRVRLARAASLLAQTTTQRPSPAELADALREVVTESESALEGLSRS
jgi:hypothetical protein